MAKPKAKPAAKAAAKANTPPEPAPETLPAAEPELKQKPEPKPKPKPEPKPAPTPIAAFPRVPEPELMDSCEEVYDYDQMDHSFVNELFVTDFLAVHGQREPQIRATILDAGTGTARIPLLLAQRDPHAWILGVDLGLNMLDQARTNLTRAGLSLRVRLERANSGKMPYPNGTFEAVISNSLIHHLTDPRPTLKELVRLVAPGGTLFIRDLFRPNNEADVQTIVQTYAANASPGAQTLFADSLRAAWTVDELRGLLNDAKLPADLLEATSDRHWTWVWQRPKI